MMANDLLSIEQITREAVAMFTRSNAFIPSMRADMAFVAGEQQWPALPSVSLPVAAAMGAAAVVIKNPVVSRRFWEWRK